ncbi:Asp-tRNA(Asn)/Glu-tRNA(Gln) amidotransferase subunit GatC [Candidatus Curtissbacteria bacterium]|nr:Asp-tRNA(Asn)/Glu-tRNA(Gln) amidotransferase subunit GatC [Candidatus Curtissbacteria bacterium]
MRKEELKIAKKRISRLSKDKASYVARLANLSLTGAEIEKFTKQLAEIIDFNIKLLEKIDVENVEPTAHISELTNITREDETKPSLNSEKALNNAKEIHNYFFKVKAILKEI